MRELERELTRAGIPASRRRRILAEFEDHLACNPAAELGDPASLARQFADELGTVRARRAGFASFGALAIAGLLFGAAFLANVQGYSATHRHPPVLAQLGLGLMVLGAQVALVSGGLAAVRAMRLRGMLTVTRAEALILGRRAAVGLVAGVAAMTGLALVAAEYSSSNTFAFIAAGVGAVGLVAATPAVATALRLKPLGDGGAGDLFDDLGGLVPASLRARPWRFALVVALAIALAIAAVGIAQQDPYDGALRGIADGLACLAGFALLGRYLGLRPT